MDVTQPLPDLLPDLGTCRVYPTRDDGRLAAQPRTRRIDEVDPLARENNSLACDA
jgi:hypothetical protein